jgi:allose kinase
MSTYAGIDLGGTHTRFAVMVDGQFVVSEKHVTAEVMADGPALAGVISRFRDIVGRAGVSPQAVGIGLPATLDAARRIVLSAPNVDGLNGLDVVSRLEGAFGVPVFAERDVNFQLFHDMRVNDRSPAVAVGVYIGTGVGNAVWINGFYTGAHGSAAELGHIPVPGATGVCGCGKVGCLETVCSGRWLRDWQETHAPSTPITELFLHHREHRDIRAFVETAAMSIATAVNLFDPELLFLGGGVLEMPGFPFDHLRSRLLAHSRAPLPRDVLDVLLASNLGDSGARGGCLYAASKFRT